MIKSTTLVRGIIIANICIIAIITARIGNEVRTACIGIYINVIGLDIFRVVTVRSVVVLRHSELRTNRT